MSGIYSTNKIKNISQLNDVILTDLQDEQTIKYNATTGLWNNAEGGGGSVTFTNYSSGTIPVDDTQGSFVRADGNLTLPPATAGKYLNILAGSGFDANFLETQTIKGIIATEWVGYSVCVSADGSVFAYGAFRADINGNNSAGYARIFRKNESGSYVAEQTIDGLYVSQQLGSYMDMNGDGTRIIIQSRSSTSSSTIPVELRNGYADVYDYSNGTWTKSFTAKGSSYSTSGNSAYGRCAISKDGNTIILSNPNTQVAGGNQTGYADVYNYSNSVWSQKGQYLTGSAFNEFFGFDIDVNADGSRIAIGQSRYTASNTGRVQVFTFDGTNWVQYGNDMAQDVGEPSEEFGRVIKFNENGTRIIVGNPNRDTANTDAGVILVYEDQSGTWTQIGSDLPGKDIANNSFGFFVDMTDDGNTILGGSIEYNNFDSYTRFYKWNGTDWDIAQTIDAPAGEGGRSLVSVVSRDGSQFVNGLAYWDGDDGSISQAGKVMLYRKGDINVAPKTITANSGDSINNGNSITVDTIKQFVCSQDGVWISN